MMRSFISIEEFADKPYAGIIGYPKATKRQLDARIRELEKLGIRAMSLSGPTMLGNLAVLGKGYAGVVVLARRDGLQVALKIRRMDSQRSSMRAEAALLELANSVGVGPKMLASSRNFLIMEFVEGVRIGPWVSSLKGAGSVRRLKGVIRKVLEECYRLDRMGFDHGELSNITKHVIVGQAGPVLIDFESSSTRRRASNVTSMTQAIYIGSGIARRVQRIYRNPSKEEIISALRRYKSEGTQESFDELLAVLKLHGDKQKFQHRQPV